MTIFFTLFVLFSSLAVLSAILVITSNNPVFAVLFLILTFCNVSALLFLANLEFLSITFIVVYVGAIAVLFLFVLMMLNINTADISIKNNTFLPMCIIFSFVFIGEISILTRLEFVPVNLAFSQVFFLHDMLAINTVTADLLESFNFDHNVRIIGKLLFTDYAINFIIVGFILLLAMIGTIALTVKKMFLSKSQTVYFQIIRNFNTSICFYS